VILSPESERRDLRLILVVKPEAAFNLEGTLQNRAWPNQTSNVFIALQLDQRNLWKSDREARNKDFHFNSHFSTRGSTPTTLVEPHARARV
jgi:hypothetical protein